VARSDRAPDPDGTLGANYQPPFALTAKLNKLTLKVDRPQLTPADIKTLEEGMKKAAAGRE
jgi:arylsulfatase